MTRMLSVLMSSVAATFVLVAAWHGTPAEAQETRAKFDPAVRPAFREPVTLASKDGVLEVRLIAKQGTATLDTVAHIPADRSNTYTYNIPKSMPQGAFWYHSHLHTLGRGAQLNNYTGRNG